MSQCPQCGWGFEPGERLCPRCPARGVPYVRKPDEDAPSLTAWERLTADERPLDWGEAYHVALERLTGSGSSSKRYQARACHRIDLGDHPSVYSERVGYRFARMFGRKGLR